MDIPPHPLVTDPHAAGWINLSIIEHEIADRELVQLIRRDRKRVLEAAARVLKYFLRFDIPNDISPCVAEHYVLPESDTRGYYSYVKLNFDVEDKDHSASDFWWAIIACPHPFRPALHGNPHYNLWRFGWECT